MFGKSMSKTEAETLPTGETVASETATLAPEQIESLKAKAAKADETWERLLRTTADFDNFKKRAAREKTEAVQFANAGLLQKLLPVLDNFEMALAAVEAVKDDKLSSLKSGVAMIQQQLRNALTETGLEEIDATGKRFDPTLHEAVSEQESSEVKEGHVLQQIRKGYRIKERLLRAAAVIVAKAPTAPVKDGQPA
jgi:molecular chaperone GrpE